LTQSVISRLNRRGSNALRLYVTSQSNLFQDADAADKIAVSLKSKIIGYVTSRYLRKLYPVKAVNSYVIPVRGGVSRQLIRNTQSDFTLAATPVRSQYYVDKHHAASRYMNLPIETIF
jgi:hypothetical protein